MTDQEMVRRIRELAKVRKAVILAHNYVSGEVQDVADIVGDSLELSIKAAAVQAPVMVFCGVSFMAETAKVLAPQATVLLPEVSAGCPMADMVTPEQVREYRQRYPEAVFIAYVNTTAAVKAEVDICCTSANAFKIAASIPEDKEIVFLPDRNLGANVAAQLHRRIILYPGYCPTHEAITPEVIQQARTAHPGTPVMVHPECRPEVVACADAAESTGGMLRFVRGAAGRGIVVGTEAGIIHRLRKEFPEKEFYPLCPTPRCRNMKKITLASVLRALENMETPVELAPELMDRARLPIERMLAVK